MILPLLVLLTACGPKITSNIIDCNLPKSPDKPKYYPVEWRFDKGLYCVTEEGAKNILKNKILQDGYEFDLETILNGARNDKNKTGK